MTPRRDIACAICGLFACAHLAVLGVTEGAHPHQREALVDASPPEPDHTHQDYRSLRFQLNTVTVSGTSSEALPPGRFLSSDAVPQARYYQDASVYFARTPDGVRSTRT